MQVTKLARTLRVHLQFLIIMPLLIILMTWPAFAQVFSTDSFWLVHNNIDANMLFWDAWYFKLWLAGQADFYFTDLLFHPTGVSLAFHNFSLPHMIVFAGLQLFMPASNAFNLTFLLLSLSTAAAGYIYLNYLFGDKWVALFGAVVFGAGAFILTRSAHPNIAFIATIPLSLYFLHRGIVECRWKLLPIAGALIGATAFIGMYTLVCLLITLMGYLMCFAGRRWKRRVFWLHVCMMFLVIGGFLVLRFYPMVADPHGISGALSKHEGSEAGKDLLGYFVNTRHPVTHRIVARLFPINAFDADWTNVVFLGYVPMLLAGLAFIRNRNRRKLLPWLALALFFLIMRLGSFLTFNGNDYPDFVLPKHYLSEAFAFLFKPFWAVDNFHAGALLPFAVLACYGLAAAVQAIPARRRPIVILLLTGATAFELYQPPYPAVFAAERMDYMAWLRQAPEQESIRLINLPFGISYHKIYGLYQSYNGYPHVAGRPTRTPAEAFDYINGNLILGAWNNNRGVTCLPGNRPEFIAAQQRLLSDGFTHIVMHRGLRRLAGEAKTVLLLPAAYEDDYVSVYRVEDLHLNCNSAAAMINGPQRNLAELIGANAGLPESLISVLSIHSYSMRDGPIYDFHSTLDFSGAEVLPLRADSLAGQGSWNPLVPAISPESALSLKPIVLLAYDPRHTGESVVDDYAAWVARTYVNCGALVESDSVVVTLYWRPDIPCGLVAAVDPLRVQYDNDAFLSNVLLERNDAFLDLYFLWRHLPEKRHSLSIQFFNTDNEKVYNQDFVIRRESLAHHRVDLAALEPGEYRLKMIVYDYETLASVPGEMFSGGARFERELELSTLSLRH